MYKQLIRPLFFRMDPEKIHHLSFNLIKLTSRLGGTSFYRKFCATRNPELEREVFGIRFPNPVGLGAGFDKDARLYEELGDFGFGFVEIGTLTPKPQAGNPKKRLFRLKKDEALINRMGFNNGGVHDAAKRLKKKRSLIVGGNIGKNKSTPNDQAVDDYLLCLETLYDHVDYFVVNVSSPNTPGLRELQDKEPLTALLTSLQKRNGELAREKQLNNPKPLLLKIAPDLTDEQLLEIIDIVRVTATDGVIATNTTISREGLKSETDLVKEQGGLSGKPLKDRSTEVIRFLHLNSNAEFPIIGVGGIHSPEDAIEKLRAGASLVQVWTGFVYEGPGLVSRINKAILKEGV